jgi:hypothetical protein
MPDPSTIFAWAVTVLAALAVLAVLAFIIVWAVLGIRRELTQDRAVSRFDPTTRYRREHSALTIPLAEAEAVRDGARRVLAGQSLRGIVLNWRRRP